MGNLPYYITSAVLRRFLEDEPRPQLMVVTVQREVAERIVAGPGEMSLLAVSVQFYGQPQIVARIPAGAFYPAPQVDSAVVRIEVGEQPAVVLPEGVDERPTFEWYAPALPETQDAAQFSERRPGAAPSPR